MYAKGWKDPEAWATRAMTTEITLSVAFVVLVSRWKRAYMDFALPQVLVTRFILMMYIFA